MRYGWIGLVEYNGRGCLTINAPLILKMRDIIFFAGKLLNGPFQGIFPGGQDFDPKIAPCCARDNLGVKKVEAPSKYPEKWPIMWFAQNKKK